MRKFSEVLPSKSEVAPQMLSPQGFSLVEMMVVLAIIGFVTLVTVVGQTTFNRTLLLTESAYSVALTLRESQSYGLGSKYFQGYTNAGYGVHFDAGTPTSYIQFADVLKNVYVVASGCPTGTAGYPDAKPGNCMYDGAGELVQQYLIGQNYKISNICGVQAGVGQVCSATYPAETIDIVFARPNTNAIITGYVNSAEIPFTQGIIHLTSPQGAERCIVVTQLGQVSVTSTCP